MWHRFVLLAMVFTIFSSMSQAQQPAPGTTNVMQQPVSSPALDRMAESMTGMAEMCKAMMAMEMKGWPLKMAALIIVGVVAVIALVLLAMLEIQWIRLLGIRIKAERRTLPGEPPRPPTT